MSRDCQKNPIKFDKWIVAGYIIYMKAEWFCFQLGGLMTTIQPNFVALTPCRTQLVGCHNHSSAVAYATGRLPAKDNAQQPVTVSVTAFVSPTGQYYVMHGNQRMDVANASTARHYVRNGVPVTTMIAASLEQLNQ